MEDVLGELNVYSSLNKEDGGYSGTSYRLQNSNDMSTKSGLI